MSIRAAMNWLKDKGLVQKADKESKHIGFDGLVEKLMAKGYTKDQATKIAGKVYWEQQAAKKTDSSGPCKPAAGEKEYDFMGRCIRHMTDDKGRDHDAAVGACLGIWNGK